MISRPISSSSWSAIIVVPALLAVETAYAPPAWLQLLIWLPLTMFSALGLLQPTKGAIVALQWQTGMHGFEEAKRRREGASDNSIAGHDALRSCKT